MAGVERPAAATRHFAAWAMSVACALAGCEQPDLEVAVEDLSADRLEIEAQQADDNAEVVALIWRGPETSAGPCWLWPSATALHLDGRRLRFVSPGGAAGDPTVPGGARPCLPARFEGQLPDATGPHALVIATGDELDSPLAALAWENFAQRRALTPRRHEVAPGGEAVLSLSHDDDIVPPTELVVAEGEGPAAELQRWPIVASGRELRVSVPFNAPLGPQTLELAYVLDVAERACPMDTCRARRRVALTATIDVVDAEAN